MSLESCQKCAEHAGTTAARAAALLMLALWVGVSISHAEQIPVRVYGVVDGLPHERVRRVVADPDGFLWFCTIDGLARFDGERFATYTGDHGLPSSDIYDFLTTLDGRRWVAAEGGACVLDSAAAETEGLFHCPDFAGIDGGVDAMALFEDSAGALWVGTDHGLFRLEEDRDSAVFRSVPLPQVTGGTAITVLSITEHPAGTLWLGTSHGIVRTGDGTSVGFDLRPSGGLDWVRGLLADDEGRLWVGHQTGLAVLLPPAGTGPLDLRELHLADGAALESPAVPGTGIWVTTDSGVSNNAVRALARTADGTIWISQIGRGLTRFDGREFRRFTTDNGLSDDTLGGIAEDRAGRLWAGSDLGGAMRIARDGLISYGLDEGLGHTFVHSILEDEVGELWVVSAGFTLNRFDGMGFRNVRPRVPDHVRDPYFFVTGTRDRNGEWWVPTPDGLFVYPRFERLAAIASLDPRKVFEDADGIALTDVGGVFEDSNGDLWITPGNTEAVRLLRLERKTGEFHRYSEAQGLDPEAAIRSIAESPGGRLWVGLADGQVGRLRDGSFERFGAESGVPEGPIGALYFDAAGRLWVGSRKGGLGRIDDPGAAGPTGRVYGIAQGLTHLDVRCIVEDRLGRIYAGTASGIDRLDESGHVRHFTTADGLANNEVFAALRDRRGSLWFGTLDGVSRLEPLPDGESDPLQVRIGGIRVGGLRQAVDELGQQEVTGLDVPPGRNSLQIDFFGLGPIPGEPLRYEYRLFGRDGWSEPASGRTVHYAALAPGRYSFEVRASNAAGLACLMPATVEFVVQPPFWRTGWFVAGLVLLLACGIYAAHRQSVSRAIAIERLRTRIATDLHDDIGANLTQIAILSDGAGLKPGAAQAGVQPALERIASISRETVDTMSDIVWAINPAWDRLSHLAGRMRRFASDLLDQSEIVLRMDEPAGGLDVPLDSETKRQVYLIFKEAMSNLARHSDGSRAEVVLRSRGQQLELTIADDGRGFDPEQARAGNGIASMRSRAAALGGALVVGPNEGGGTRVTLFVPLRRARTPPPT